MIQIEYLTSNNFKTKLKRALLRFCYYFIVMDVVINSSQVHVGFTLKSKGGKNELIPKTKTERSIVVHQAKRFRRGDERYSTLTNVSNRHAEHVNLCKRLVTIFFFVLCADAEYTFFFL